MDEPAHSTPPELHPHQQAQTQRAALLRIVRFIFIVLFFTVTALIVLDIEPGDPRTATFVLGAALNVDWPAIVAIGLAIVSIILLIEAFTPSNKIGTLFSIFFGLLAALLATVAIGFVVDLLAITYDFDQAKNLIAAIKLLIGIALAYLGVTTVLQTQDDFRLVIPYVEFAKQIRGPRPLLLDSSALIDARIVDLGNTGILQAPLIIPRFVVGELQLMADSVDKLKRARGRRGLDVIGRLQRIAGLDVSLDEAPVPGKAVDQMLVEMGRSMPAVIVTADVALARIASIQGVRVLNLNDVANALKPALIPGEQVSLMLIKPGEQQGQGVGYLDDGTMVVAEDGGHRIGQRVTLSITSTLQTSAGRLLFGRVVPDLDSVPQPAPSDGDTSAPASLPTPPGPGNDETDEAAEGEPAAAARSPFPPKGPSPRSNRARNPRR